ncbi:protein argonaute 6-like [Herrania umbratica]|uniref:Protein argonaute 6-like n=1 Tax=Herrania umbratica TaxID=108875 RepID=A0A6J1BR80_9ROSI|nr:protein argonaute 6-like [Herrania umbratica]
MEKAEGTEEAGKSPSLLPPPPTMPPNVKPESMKPPKYSIVSRRGVGVRGRHISLLTNHFKVSVNAADAVFYQYTVTISSEDNRAVESKGIGRKLLDKLYQTYSSELAGKRFAYDGEKSLYTVGPLPQKKFDFTIVLEESFAKRYIVLHFSDFWILNMLESSY